VNGQTVRGYRYRDAGRGVNLDAGQDNRTKDGKNYATSFPQQSARGASWDLDLEYRVGLAIGDETAASLNNMLLAPCMNVIRHPYWGRTQETYSEDPFHVGRMASALTAGIQQHVAACAKHYAANNVERNRANQDARMDEQTLREIYLRHFEMVVQDGGASCIMAAYNKINGIKLTQNKKLLTDILRGPLSAGGMAFRGTVLSDWWAMPGDQNVPLPGTAQAQAAEAAAAGLDIEVPWTLNYSQLNSAIRDGALAQSVVETSAERVLEQKFRFKSALSTDGWGRQSTTVTSLGTGDSGGSIVGNDPHLDLAEEAATKSTVLLTNGPEGMPVLPIVGKTSIVVAGLDLPVALQSTTPPISGPTLSMATHVSLGDRGSSRVNADPAKSVGPFDGIKQIAATHNVTNVTSANSVEAVTAANPDLIVAVVGLAPGDEGEEYAIRAGGDRATLNLPHGQNEFVAGLLGLMKPTVIIIQAGSIVELPWLAHANKNVATIWAGYPGQRGGLAYGKLLFGDKNFSGKMPMVWPLEADLLPFINDPSGIAVDMGYFFGYREYDRRIVAGETPANLVFPFGHGLSYSTFKYENLSVPCTTVTEKSIINVTVDITNTSAVPGAEVALLFVKGPATAPGVPGAARAVKELKSFNRVELAAMAGMRLPLPIRVQDLRHWQGGANGSWVIDKGKYTVLVGKNAADAEANASATPPLVGEFMVE
jgi:beta-glucosidase